MRFWYSWSLSRWILRLRIALICGVNLDRLPREQIALAYLTASIDDENVPILRRYLVGTTGISHIAASSLADHKEAFGEEAMTFTDAV